MLHAEALIVLLDLTDHPRIVMAMGIIMIIIMGVAPNLLLQPQRASSLVDITAE